MSTKNDITGDSLVSKAATEAYRNNYDSIFGRKKDTKMIDEHEQHDSDEGEWICECCGGPMYRQAHWNYGQCDDCGARQELEDDY